MGTKNKNINIFKDWGEYKIKSSDIKKFEKRKKKELEKSEKRACKNEIMKIKQQNKIITSRNGKISATTTKKLMYLILINCTVVELYSMIIMAVLHDLTPLYSLIGAVIGESFSYAVYCTKSYVGTKEEERLKFEREVVYKDTFTSVIGDKKT